MGLINFLKEKFGHHKKEETEGEKKATPEEKKVAPAPTQ